MSALTEKIAAITAKPWVAHLLRANERFNGRLGVQFTAAAAYFSVLSLVPIISLVFSIIGFVLTVVRPELRSEVSAFVTSQLGRGATTQQVIGLINAALDNYAAVGVIGLLTAAYSGASWMGNLRNAVQAQMRSNFDLEISQPNIVVATLMNLVTLFGLLVMIAITFGLAAISTSVSSGLLAAFGLADVDWLVAVLRIGPILVSVGAGWLLFMYLFTVLPERHAELGPRRRGALIGAIGLLVLQYTTGLLFKAFSGNAAVALFGPVIVLLLFFNLFARLILFVAAWIATANEPAFSAVGPPVRTEDLSGAERGELAAAIRSEEAHLDPAEPDPAATDRPSARPLGAEPVPAAVAARGVRLGLGAGYLTGAATGVGLGAVAAYAAQRFRRWRGRS